MIKISTITMTWRKPSNIVGLKKLECDLVQEYSIGLPLSEEAILIWAKEFRVNRNAKKAVLMHASA